MKTEKDLEKYTVKLCKRFNVTIRKFVSPAKRGVPDRILIGRQGRIVFLELKHPVRGGKVSKLQREECTLLRERNCEIYVTNSPAVIREIVISLDSYPAPTGGDHTPLRVRSYLFGGEHGNGEDGYKSDGSGGTTFSRLP